MSCCCAALSVVCCLRQPFTDIHMHVLLSTPGTPSTASPNDVVHFLLCLSAGCCVSCLAYPSLTTSASSNTLTCMCSPSHQNQLQWFADLVCLLFSAGCCVSCLAYPSLTTSASSAATRLWRCWAPQQLQAAAGLGHSASSAGGCGHRYV
jgi:hypothetical protein